MKKRLDNWNSGFGQGKTDKSVKDSIALIVWSGLLFVGSIVGYWLYRGFLLFIEFVKGFF